MLFVNNSLCMHDGRQSIDFQKSRAAALAEKWPNLNLHWFLILLKWKSYAHRNEFVKNNKTALVSSARLRVHYRQLKFATSGMQPERTGNEREE